MIIYIYIYIYIFIYISYFLCTTRRIGAAHRRGALRRCALRLACASGGACYFARARAYYCRGVDHNSITSRPLGTDRTTSSGSSTIISISHGSDVATKLLSERSKRMFVCARTSLSTFFCPSRFLLLEWTQPSMDQACSHPEAEHVSDVTRSATHIKASQWYKNVFAHTKGAIAHPWVG